jgi:hypothetical protein
MKLLLGSAVLLGQANRNAGPVAIVGQRERWKGEPPACLRSEQLMLLTTLDQVTCQGLAETVHTQPLPSYGKPFGLRVEQRLSFPFTAE